MANSDAMARPRRSVLLLSEHPPRDEVAKR
jgi:hypothetical protein